MFVGHDPAFWTTIGTWAYVALTASIAFFAQRAWKSSQGQLDALKVQQSSAEKAHTEQLAELKASREAGLRPVLVLDDLEVEIEPGRANLLIKSRNVGTGPALWSTFQIWMRELGPHDEAWIRQARESDLGAGTIRTLPVVLAARRAPSLTAELPAEVFGSDCLLVRVDVQYQDVFGNVFHHPVNDRHVRVFTDWPASILR